MKFARLSEHKYRRVKSPSKYLSLDFLMGLQKSYYIAPSGQEYSKEEVDRLVSSKSDHLLRVDLYRSEESWMAAYGN